MKNYHVVLALAAAAAVGGYAWWKRKNDKATVAASAAVVELPPPPSASNPTPVGNPRAGGQAAYVKTNYPTTAKGAPVYEAARAQVLKTAGQAGNAAWSTGAAMASFSGKAVAGIAPMTQAAIKQKAAQDTKSVATNMYAAVQSASKIAPALDAMGASNIKFMPGF